MPEHRRDPERSGRRAWWQRLGDALPAEIRDRVYEPCCYDQLRRVVTGGGTPVPFGLYAALAFTTVVGLNFPSVVRYRWRTSPPTRRVAALGVLGLVSAWLVLRVAYLGY